MDFSIKFIDKTITVPSSAFGKDKDGWRGILLAVNKTKTEGIIQWGKKMILVKETNPKKWPIEVKDMSIIPPDFDIVTTK